MRHSTIILPLTTSATNHGNITTRVLDNIQMAVFTSAKSAQYVQMLLLGHKQTSAIQRGTSDFQGVGKLLISSKVYKSHIMSLYVVIFGSRRWYNNSTMIYTVTIGLISEIGHTSNRRCQYTKIFSTART